ncbi:MAG TPA: low molecular weight protein-tyrosine-phosphatase [Candidatus Binatia bacterium]|jgi:protein-tyrosine phosphatase
MVKVLFVCTGNICRSPTAEGVMRSFVRREGLESQIEVASAGTHAYHVGEGADSRTVRAARRRGYDLGAHRARKVTAGDLQSFDHVLAMDRDNLRQLDALEASTPRVRTSARLFLEGVPRVKYLEVPDPYALADEGFEIVLDLVESGCEALLERIREGG